MGGERGKEGALEPPSKKSGYGPATDSESDSLHNAFGIRLIRVILSSAPPHFPFTGQPGLQVPLAENNDPLTVVSG